MTEFSKARISHAAELVHLICEKSGDIHRPADEEQSELYAWLQGVVDHNQEQALSEFLRMCGPAGGSPYSVAKSMVRAVGSVCQIDGQSCALFGFPVVFDSEKEFLLRSIECRQKIELALEEAKGLRFKSVRLCQFPVRRVAVENLSAWQLGRLGRDLYRYADSKLLRATTVGSGLDVLIWLGLYKLDSDDGSVLFDKRQGPSLGQWGVKTKSWLMEELSPQGVGRCSVTAPLRIHDAITATRLHQAKSEWLQAKNVSQADLFTASLASGRLHWVFLNSQSGQKIEGETWLPDENEYLGLDALGAFAKKYSLTYKSQL